MFEVWQYGPAFLQGAKPWAVSESLSKLEDWAKVYIPHRGHFRFFWWKVLAQT
jgi:hypothetical protein